MFEENEKLSAEIICPYCEAVLGTYLCDSPQLECCFGCDQWFVIDWSVNVDKLRKVEGYKKIK